MDYGHWVGLEFEASEHLGFVYVITNLLSGRKYIGQKQLHSTLKRPPLKGRVNKRHSKRESDWRTYMGSSVSLNADILKFGKENFKFEILEVYDSKWEMSYGEYSRIIKEGAIPNRAYYNEFLGKIGKCPEKAKY